MVTQTVVSFDEIHRGVLVTDRRLLANNRRVQGAIVKYTVGSPEQKTTRSVLTHCSITVVFCSFFCALKKTNVSYKDVSSLLVLTRTACQEIFTYIKKFDD